MPLAKSDRTLNIVKSDRLFIMMSDRTLHIFKSDRLYKKLAID
ncbi:hypothetical protein [Nostoc spongiaeforme]|nr:hypothetical protein [Nostoc spongiaeforme]